METECIVKPPQSRALKSGRVLLSPGESVGWHVTHDREELIVVLNGTATVIENNQETQLGAGDTYYIRNRTEHNVRNDSSNDLEYIYAVSLLGSSKHVV